MCFSQLDGDGAANSAARAGDQRDWITWRRQVRPATAGS
jgi:hypothetical protein